MPSQPHILLIDGTEGNTEGIRFPSSEAARTWEDAHPQIVARGCIRLISKTEALAATNG